MLDAELAKKQLEEIKVEKWLDQRLAKLAKLPAEVRQTARILLGQDMEDKDWQETRKLRREHTRRFGLMKAPDRAKILQTIFGDLTPYVEGALKMMTELPYQTDNTRKAFRAPSRPELADERRDDWLSTIIETLQGYPQDILWLAAWAPHLGYRADSIGLLLAAAIDIGGATGQKLYDILIESAQGEHEIGGMGRHIVRALLTGSRPEGWEFIEKMLLAAQREEGLRQSILETIDEAHPQAFRRMLRLILDHDLARFSATVRALDTWFGFQWDAVSTKKVNDVIEKVLVYLDDPKARQAAIAGKEPEQTYLALWAMACEDAPKAIAPAQKLLKDAKVERRFIGAHLLAMLDIDEADQALAAALDDADLRVAGRAIIQFQHRDEDALAALPNVFERAEALIKRIDAKKKSLEPIVWPWYRITLDVESFTRMLQSALGSRSPAKLIPYLSMMSTWQRSSIVDLLAKTKGKKGEKAGPQWEPAIRDTLFALVGDSAAGVRESAVKALANCRIQPAEAETLEGYLGRKAGDLRRGVLGLLESQADEAALASADRLLAAGQESQRIAGLELLRRMREARRCIEECRQRATAYQANRKKLGKEEVLHLETILAEERVVATLDDALGLMDPSKRTPPPQPRKCQVQYVTPAAVALLKSLDALIEEHREDMVVIGQGKDDADEAKEAASEDEGEPKAEEPKRQEPLGTITWGFPSPDNDVPVEKDVRRLPLRALWEGWWKGRPAAARDRDGLELIRARWLASLSDGYDDSGPAWLKPLRKVVISGLKAPELKYDRVAGEVLDWLLRIYPPKCADFLLDGLENVLALLPANKLTEAEEYDESPGSAWRSWGSPVSSWQDFADDYDKDEYGWGKAQQVRFFQLMRWYDEPAPGVARDRPALSVPLAAFAAGGATEADIYDQVLGARSESRYGNSFRELSHITRPKLGDNLQGYDFIKPIADRCRTRILEIELQRGDTPTAASAPALGLETAGGLDVFVRVATALGKGTLTRSRYGGDSLAKAHVFSHLIQLTRPADGDTPEAFATRLKEAGLSDERLVELAMYAPRWATHVEHTVQWPALVDAIWWFRAHTKDADTVDDEEGKDRSAVEIGQRTPLTAADLKDGAVDVAWFNRVHAAVGAKRWDVLHDAAKYASSGAGHARARLFADAMLDRLAKSELLKRINTKRYQDGVRALGLIPLARGAAAKAEVLQRYKVMAEFIRTSRQFGSQRQASEKRAAAIGMANLARTAGYPDPMRLQWAMEAEQCADLAKGPVSVKSGEVTVSLAIDDQGQPEVSVVKNDKPLANIPPAVKKLPAVKELTDRKADLRRSASRMRQSLEQAMCRGDVFAAPELRELMANPILSPMLQRLVFIGEGILGYPMAGGRALTDCAGKVEPIKKDEKLRLAHPHDLLATKKWTDWQRDCFAAERVQPFKQIFRELYVLTKTERQSSPLSRRYAGHQVQPRQAMALLTARSWVVAPDQGVFRTFHDADLTAWLTFQESFYTPAEVEGLTLEGVAFTKRGEHKPLPLAKIPPRLFSEVMRDMDLVVSVAHRGGVDPEASASTVEMRSQILRETCQLLQIKNVRLKDTHVLIDGKLGKYTVHLGSAVTHRMPGGALFIVAVHSQHRGRLFLPFADNDPKTAEVISKVILLARDEEIKDPNIIAQIRGG